MIRSFRGITPRIAASAYVDRERTGDRRRHGRRALQRLAQRSLRGDIGPIRIGSETNIQDNCALHEDQGFPLTIGDRVTVGHSVTLHGCTVEDDSLIGIGATVLNGARIGTGAVVAAGSLVPEGMEVPPATLVMGVPAKVRRPVTRRGTARFVENATQYVEKARIYREEAQ